MPGMAWNSPWLWAFIEPNSHCSVWIGSCDPGRYFPPGSIRSLLFLLEIDLIVYCSHTPFMSTQVSGNLVLIPQMEDYRSKICVLFVCFSLFLQTWPLIWDVWKVLTGSGLFSEVIFSSHSSLLNLGYAENSTYRATRAITSQNPSFNSCSQRVFCSPVACVFSLVGI